MRAQPGWWWVSIWVAGEVALSAAGHEERSERSRFVLRAGSTHAEWLIGEGRQRSPTLRWLIDELEVTDLIVYVATEPLADLAGRTVFQVEAGGHRYLVVTISTRQPRTVQLATLAHELVHALEVADAPEVRSQAGVRALFERIGERLLGPARYETATARRIGDQTMAEILTGRNHPADVRNLARLVRPGTGASRTLRPYLR